MKAERMSKAEFMKALLHLTGAVKLPEILFFERIVSAVCFFLSEQSGPIHQVMAGQGQSRRLI